MTTLQRARACSRTAPRRLLVLAAIPAMAIVLSGCGSGDGEPRERASTATAAEHGSAAEIGHVHGLGVDPGSGALLVATHEGLFRAQRGQSRLEPVGQSRRDLMGFSVAGPRRFLASGHPAPDERQPHDLGLIESRDGGESWRTVSLSGEADFHVLRSSGRQIYGFNGATGELMVSSDGGRTWARRTPPAGIYDLAISPDDPRHIVSSTERGLFASMNAGEDWALLRDDTAGLLAWTAPDSLFVIDGQGRVSRGGAGGRRLTPVGSIGGQPVAFTGRGAELYAALADGTVVRSDDGGANWAVRITP